MEAVISISKSDLAAACQRWEEDARAGKCQPRPNATPKEIGEANAEYLFDLLTAKR
jgi:hypothetical protein